MDGPLLQWVENRNCGSGNVLRRDGRAARRIPFLGSAQLLISCALRARAGALGGCGALKPYPSEGDFPWVKFPQGMAILVYACALGAVRSGNAPAVSEEIERLQRMRKAMIEAKIGYWVHQADIQIKVASA